MTQHISDNSPASTLFPEYDTVYDLIAREVEGLTDEQLDWVSDQWGWSEWSIRRQLSHMASLVYRWMLVRWEHVLFPDGVKGYDDIPGIANSDVDRALSNDYWELPEIMKQLKGAIELVQGILAEHDVAFLRNSIIPHQRSPQWVLMVKAHPSGIEPQTETDEGTMNLEACMRHMYFEETTHLYNIQRLKRAQGLPTVVDVPKVGYWVLDGWDRSEP